MVDHFEEYTLTSDDLFHAAIVFGAILIVVMVTAKFLCKEQKKLAWSISLVNSGLMTAIGIVYMIVKGPRHPELFMFGPGGRELLHTRDNVSVLTCVWFGLANICDMVFGQIFYPKYLSFLTTYFHHTLFIWVMYMSVTGDAIICKVTPYTSMFNYMLLLEVPTFLLALGSVFPAFRTDLGFGVSFGFFRLLFHLYFIFYGYYSKIDTIPMVLYCLTWFMHLFWFTTWASKYASYKAKSKAKADAAAAESVKKQE